MKAIRIQAVFIGLFAVFSVFELNGQVTNSLYFMPGVPQANRVNPAIQPRANFYLGMPGLSPLRVEVSSSSVSYSDLIYYDASIDSLITFLHPNGDKSAFLSNMKPVNFVASDIGASLVSFGFRAGGNFFSVDVTSRVDGNVYYPGDLFNLLVNGTEDGKTYKMDGIGVDLAMFDEVSVGWSRSILDNLDIGARAKLLFGIGDLSTKKSEVQLTTAQDMWTLQSNLTMNTSLPFAEVIYDDEGNIEDIYLKDELDPIQPGELPKYLFNTRNMGFAADLGVNYRPLDKLLVSASVTDLGFIRWSDEIHDAHYQVNRFDFSGIEVDPTAFSDDFTFSDLVDSTFTEISDSLISFLEMQPGQAYSKRLNTKLYIGASYSVTPKINFGLLSRTDFLNGKVSPQFTASANFTTGRLLNFTMSYSYINAYFKNIGAGVSFNAGPFNMYLISDNVLNVVFWPQEAQSVNLWFGLNLVFGYKDFMNSEPKDKPLVY